MGLRNGLGNRLSFAIALVLTLAAQRAMAQGLGYIARIDNPSQITAGTSTPITVQSLSVSPTINSLTYSFTGPAGVTITPSNQTSSRAAGFPSLLFTIIVAPNIVPGPKTVVGNITVIGPGGSRVGTLSFTFLVPAPSGFSMTVAPSILALSAGETRTLAVILTPGSLFGISSPVGLPEATVTVVAPSGIIVTPSSFTIPIPGTQTVTVTVSPAISGPFPLTFIAASGGITHSASAQVQVLPAVATLVPSSVTAPSLSTTLRVAGTSFSAGGTFVSTSPDIVIERTIVYSPTLADVVVHVRDGAAVGPRRLDFRNADGAASVRAGTVYVVPAGGIGAPLGVTTAAIVFPVDGTLIGDNEAIYPRAMLATSGTGTISGTWSVDDVPFDRFAATASAAPVEVRTHVPVPPSAFGTHRIKLVIETPKLGSAPAVSYTAVRESVTRLSFYEPGDRAVVESHPRLRWSLVPGATGYVLELRRLDANGKELGGTRIRTTQTAWTPPNDLTGMLRFRVRAMFPGDVRGEPTPWSTAVFLPAKASLRIDAAAGGRVVWSGGTPGMIYRVEFQRAGARCFDALTFTPEYRFPTGIAWRDCDAVRVRAAAPSGTFLGQSEPRHLAAGFAPPAALAHAMSPFSVVEQEPRPATTVAARTVVAVRWRDGDERDAALLIDGVDVTPVAARQSGGIRYEALLPLRAGRHVAALAMPAGLVEWTFAAAEEPAAPAAATAYVIAPAGSVTWATHPATGHGSETAAVSSKGESGDITAGTGASVTGNLNYSGTSDPTHLGQASHDWLAEGRVMREGVFGSARVGYTTPDFTDAAKYLVSGAASLGVVARAGSKLGTISYYEPIYPNVQGVLSAIPQDRRIRGLALATPEGQRFVVRLIGLEVQEQEQPDVLAGSGGAKTRTYGIFARYTFSPAAELIGEIARGTLTPGTGTVAQSQRGNAARLAVGGAAAGTTYQFGISKVDPDFVTPANRVFTAGYNNRVDTDLSLARAFGKATFTLAAARNAQGRAHDTPRGTKHEATLGMISPLSARLALEASAGFTRDSAETTLLLPLGTDRFESRAATKLTETFTRISLAEEMKWSRTNDRAEPASDVTMNEIAVSVNGALLTNMTLTTSAGFSRTKASPLVGTNDRWTLSFMPAIAVPKLLLSLRPSFTIDRSTADVTDTRTRSEVYGTTIEWLPPWLQSLLSGQLSGTLSRTVNTAPVPSRTRSRAATASVIVHTKKARGLPMFAAPPPLPGTVPPLPPEPTPTAPPTTGTQPGKG